MSQVNRRQIIIILLFLSISIYSFPGLSAQINDETGFSAAITEAKIAKTAGRFEDSITYYTDILQKAKASGDKHIQNTALLELGVLFWNIGELEPSVEYYKQAISLSRSLDLTDELNLAETAIKIHDLYQEGKKHRDAGSFPESYSAFEKAIDLANTIDSPEHEVKCLRLLGNSYYYANDNQKFREKNEEALKLALLLNHVKSKGRCQNNLGVYYDAMGNYSRALEFYIEALEIFREMGNPWDISDCLNNIGICYQNLGDYDRAHEYLQEALEIDKELGDEINLSMVLNNIGENYRLKGLISRSQEDLKKAREYFRQCLDLAKKTKHKQTEIHALNNIGNIYTDMEDYTEGLLYFNSALEMAKETQDIESQGMLLNNIGIVHHNQGNYSESSEYFQRAIDLAMVIKHDKILWEAFLEMGRNYAKQNQYQKALEKFKQSISVIEDIRSNIKLEELKASFFGTDKRLEAYHDLIELLTKMDESDPDQGYDHDAFNYMERAIARAFLDRLELSRVNISSGIDHRLQNQEKELMKNISIVYTKLLDNGLSADDKKTIEDKLDQYEDDLEALKRDIRSNSPAYADLKYPRIINLKEAQKKLLDNKTAFFAYLLGSESSHAFAITTKDIKIFKLPPKEELASLIKSYLKALTDQDNNNFQNGRILFQELVKPGLDIQIQNIIIIPADILNALPFETLITEEDRWLIEDYKISYAPSITSLREIIARNGSNHKSRRKDILAIGDPDFGELEKEDHKSSVLDDFYGESSFQFYRLQYSGEEIMKISKLFNLKKSDVFKREQASEEMIKNHDIENYKILHFATHSLINEKLPARSSIMLTLDNDPTEDGFLQTREIYNLKLNADLVTLSACHTGGGQFIRGEGVEGLNRAFFYAGTASVLMSLWSVNDHATSQLMERFYIHLRSSQPTVNALRKAKLEMINSGVLDHPYFWAGFIVSGDADKVIFPNLLKKWALLGLSIVLVGGILVMVIRRRNNNR